MYEYNKFHRVQNLPHDPPDGPTPASRRSHATAILHLHPAAGRAPPHSRPQARDRADPRWAPATQRKKRVLPQRDASDNENVLTMFMKMKHMESELRRIKAFRRAECKRTIARVRGQLAKSKHPNGPTRGSQACRAARQASADTRRRGGGLASTLAAAFAASYTTSEQDRQNIREAQDYKPTVH